MCVALFTGFARTTGSRCSATGPRRIRIRTLFASLGAAMLRVAVGHDGADAFAIRQADTLNSGILLRGSRVRWVSMLALFPGQ